MVCVVCVGVVWCGVCVCGGEGAWWQYQITINHHSVPSGGIFNALSGVCVVCVVFVVCGVVWCGVVWCGACVCVCVASARASLCRFICIAGSIAVFQP